MLSTVQKGLQMHYPTPLQPIRGLPILTIPSSLTSASFSPVSPNCKSTRIKSRIFTTPSPFTSSPPTNSGLSKGMLRVIPYGRINPVVTTSSMFAPPRSARWILAGANGCPIHFTGHNIQRNIVWLPPSTCASNKAFDV